MKKSKRPGATKTKSPLRRRYSLKINMGAGKRGWPYSFFYAGREVVRIRPAELARRIRTLLNFQEELVEKQNPTLNEIVGFVVQSVIDVKRRRGDSRYRPIAKKTRVLPKARKDGV